jgi:hypothetical protein
MLTYCFCTLSCRSLDHNRTEQILEELEKFRLEAAAYTAEASTHTSQSTELVSRLATFAQRIFKYQAQVNPNRYSIRRWRWIWVIERIMWANRVSRIIMSFWSW